MGRPTTCLRPAVVMSLRAMREPRTPEVRRADLADFGGGDGLLVGDDGEGFERLKGEFEGRLKGFDEGADGVVVFGASSDSEAAGHFANFETAIGDLDRR